jgi:hypothetical protein
MPLNHIRFQNRSIATYDFISLLIFQITPIPRLGMLSFRKLIFYASLI